MSRVRVLKLHTDTGTEDKLYVAEEASRIIGIPAGKIRTGIRNGTFCGHTECGRYYVSQMVIDFYLNATKELTLQNDIPDIRMDLTFKSSLSIIEEVYAVINIARTLAKEGKEFASSRFIARTFGWNNVTITTRMNIAKSSPMMRGAIRHGYIDSTRAEHLYKKKMDDPVHIIKASEEYLSIMRQKPLNAASSRRKNKKGVNGE